MKCNAMQWTKKEKTKESDIGLLVFYEGVMNERFVAVSVVTGSRICGYFSKPRCDFSVTRGWYLIDAVARGDFFAARGDFFAFRCRVYIVLLSQSFSHFSWR